MLEKDSKDRTNDDVSDTENCSRSKDCAAEVHAEVAVEAKLVVWPAVHSRGASLRLVRNPLRVATPSSDEAA